MPNRVIREGLLDSARYWSVTVEARQLFVHLMLLADDFGLVSLAPVLIRRRCFDDAPTPAKVDKLLEQLHDADLIRIYENGGGKYAFVPRFGQVLRQMRARCPEPPHQLFQDDRKAVEKFQQNKDVFRNLHSSGTASVAQLQRSGMSESKLEGKGREKESESKKDTSTAAQQEPCYRDLTEWAAVHCPRLQGESDEAHNRRATIAYSEQLGRVAS